MDRPKECLLCTNPEKILYREPTGKDFCCTKMCYECPCLEEKLQSIAEEPSQKKQDEDAKLFCTNCKASLYDMKTGKAFGCSACHELFGDLLIDEVLSQNHHVSYREIEDIKLPSRSFKEKLALLHKDLTSSLEAENYEVAAKLRDEIQEISQKSTFYSNYNYN